MKKTNPARGTAWSFMMQVQSSQIRVQHSLGLAFADDNVLTKRSVAAGAEASLQREQSREVQQRCRDKHMQELLHLKGTRDLHPSQHIRPGRY